jgi:hypothetical protein
MFVYELHDSLTNVAEAVPNAKRWRRSRDRGLLCCGLPRHKT